MSTKTTIKNRIGRFFEKVRNWFAHKPAKSKSVPPGDQPKEGLDYDEFYDEYAKKIEGLDDVIVTLGIHKRIAASHKYMYEMGRRDGSLGATLHNLLEIAKVNAQEMFRHVYVIIKGKLAALQGKYDADKSILQNNEDIYKRDQAYYDYATYQSRFFPRSHSLFLFVLYLVFAVALIVADMPLALKLIQDGFNLEGGTGKETFPHLFRGNFWQIISANWETAITATGIALCTIYIKIYYDEFVGTPYANRLMTFKRFLSENGISDSADDVKDIRSESKRKSIVKTVLFGITIASIVFLALFRLQTVAAKNHFDVNFFSGAAFIAITLLFPIIGGVCLSYSLNNIQNLWRLRMARIKCRRSRQRWMRLVRRFTTIEKDYNDMLAADRRLTDEDRLVEEYTQYLMAFYRRGYVIGGMQPDKYTGGEDFFTKILEWRNIATSRKINQHIGNLN